MNRATTLVFAHRGASGEAAENTRSAFDRALAYAADGIETDVQLSRDDVPVLWHDDFLGKLGLPGRRIDDFDCSQLRAMNFARYFGEGATQESIVSLQDFIQDYRKRCRLLLEIKNRAGEPAARRTSKVRQTLDLVGTADGERIVVSSFDLDCLVDAHQYRPEFPLVYNLESGQSRTTIPRVLAEKPFLHGLCLPIATLDGAVVALLRDHKKLIAVYTCNSAREIHKALQLGVDILISDWPQQALHMRDG